MRLGVPFIAPRQLGVVEGILGRQFLPSVGWRTGQSGAPPDIHCSLSSADLLPKMAHPTVAEFEPLAHRTVRCTPDSPVPHRTSTVHCPVRISFLKWRIRPLQNLSRWRTGQSGAHRTVRCPIPTVGAPTCHARIARPTVGAVDHWLTGQSGEL
jgi:hypothetical protein